MNADTILLALGEIDDELIREAGAPRKRRTGRWNKWGAAAACLCLIFLGLWCLRPSGGTTVTAWAVGTGQKIGGAGAVMETGMIRDGGEMTGHPLRFYLTGRGIDHVRFSCEKGKLDFTDWTEQREEYGLAGNFVVNYGADEGEYRSLVLEWVPEHLIRTLTEGPVRRIAELPAEQRRDRIIMEITLADGTTRVKEITVSLLDDGTFFAAYDDHSLTAEDTFVQRPDAEPIPREVLSGGPEQAPAERPVPPSAEQAARDYYRDTVWELVSLHPVRATEQEIAFEVRVRKNNVLQDPPRTIVLEKTGGAWRVTNEGY